MANLIFFAVITKIFSIYNRKSFKMITEHKISTLIYFEVHSDLRNIQYIWMSYANKHYMKVIHS